MKNRKLKKLDFSIKNEIPEVSQTFVSLEGEGVNAGEPSLYIRFAGCYSAACSFCDTKFSWYKKDKFPKMITDEFKIGNWVNQVTGNKAKRLTITGGEPLHYLPFLRNINVLVEKLNSDYDFDINWLGIESNGNLLADVNNVVILTEVFNKLKKSGINPQLTISPKINSEVCYEGQMNQIAINGIYQKVFENVENFLSFPVYYKFVWNVSEYDDQLILNQLEILKELKVDQHRIFFMPYTPKDPLGTGKKEWEKSKLVTARAALKHNVRYSPRIHVDLELD